MSSPRPNLSVLMKLLDMVEKRPTEKRLVREYRMLKMKRAKRNHKQTPVPTA